MCSRVASARIVALLAAVCCACLGGCASKAKPDPTLAVPAGRYADAFEAAKDALREFEFELDRIDAAGGVVTTHARGSAGLATPWIPHMSTSKDAARGFVERERRRAAIVFEPQNADAPRNASDEHPTMEGPIDLAFEPIDPEAALTARVHVWVERVYRPGRRVSATSVRLSSFTSDPELREQGLEPAFAETVREDDALGGRLAASMARRLGAGN